MNKMLKLAFAGLVIVGFGATAETASESKAKIEDVRADQNKASGEDVDQLITNKKMRAESGSKSRYSLASQIYYNGGSVERPMDEIRPNIGGAPGTTDVAQLNGQLSAKYKIDQQWSLMAGFGFRYITPFHGSDISAKARNDYSGNKLDAENPYLLGQYVYKAGGFQNVVTLKPRYITASDLKNKKYMADITLDQNSIYEVGTTGLSLGIYQAIDATVYTDNEVGQNDYGFYIDPFIEYQMNDMINLRTVFNLWNYHHIRGEKWDTFAHDNLIQSFGVGIAINRDIYLYPNVQFVLDDIRSDRTNVALNSYINLF